MSQETPLKKGSSRSGSRQWNVAWRRYVPVLLILVFGATFSFLIWDKATSNQDHHLRHEFENVTDNYSLLITGWIERRFQALESIRSFYNGSQDVDRSEFTTFVRPYFKDRTDIHAIMWAPLVRGSQRDESFPALYIESDDTAIAGYDLAGDPALVNAMKISRQTGRIVASERVQFPGCPETQYGICVFVPVFDQDAPQAGEDLSSLQGFIVGFLHIDEAVENALDITRVKPLCIDISDDLAPEGNKVLYSYCSTPNGEYGSWLLGERNKLQHRTHCQVGQRNWTISFKPCKGSFSAYRSSQPLWVLVTGLLLTVLTALCFLMSLGRTLRIERLVAERTQQLCIVNDSLEAEIAEGKKVQAEKENLLNLLLQANDELIEANEKLSQSNHELEDFAYIASHDLQEPLRKVTAFGERLMAGYSDEIDETGRDYVARMQSAARRMSTLINDMLTYSRVASNAQPFAQVDLDETVRQVLEDLEVRIEELGATVDVGPLPCVQADGLQMRQLMQNLISNALKFHKPDTSPTVKIYRRQVDEDAIARGLAAEVVVEDDGIGFDEKYNDQIFRMFQRLHGRDEYEGTGVGLAICKKIAERHGVAINVRSINGQGAEFALMFTGESVLFQPAITNTKSN